MWLRVLKSGQWIINCRFGCVQQISYCSTRQFHCTSSFLIRHKLSRLTKLALDFTLQIVSAHLIHQIWFDHLVTNKIFARYGILSLNGARALPISFTGARGFPQNSTLSESAIAIGLLLPSVHRSSNYIPRNSIDIMVMNIHIWSCLPWQKYCLAPRQSRVVITVSSWAIQICWVWKNARFYQSVEVADDYIYAFYGWDS